MKRNVFYHNSRCRKSREGLALLQRTNIDFEIVEYLQIPPSKEDLKFILDGLGMKPLQLMRTQEKVFKELNLSKKDERSDEEWIDIMVRNPILIERPVLIFSQKVALGRPPDNLLKIL